MSNDFSYRKLEVWRVGMEAARICVENRGCFRGLPGEVGPQLERAMVSVLNNIAEGAGRWTPADQRRHYQIACGSATEMMASLEIARLYGTVKDDVFSEIESRMIRVVQMLLALIRRR